MMNDETIWLEADWLAPKHIRAGTTTRLNGNSKGNYFSLNLASHVGDIMDDVKQNRNKLRNTLSLPNDPTWLNQTHSSRVIYIDQTKVIDNNADGAYSDKRNVICTVLTADCVPVLLTDFEGNKVAALHAGWKGICNGILDRVNDIFNDKTEVLAWVGPCISKNFYEIGDDVYNASIKYQPETKQAFTKISATKWLCDLPMMVEIILQINNVNQIYQSKLCCYKDDDKFYSYRRNKQTGRTASMIWME